MCNIYRGGLHARCKYGLCWTLFVCETDAGSFNLHMPNSSCKNLYIDHKLYMKMDAIIMEHPQLVRHRHLGKAPLASQTHKLPFDNRHKGLMNR